jgi:hypothetical protein
MRLAQISLIFGMPLIAAAVRAGGAWKRLGWYAGTVILALFSILVVAVIYAGPGPHPIALIVWPLSANVLMVALAASGPRKSK